MENFKNEVYSFYVGYNYSAIDHPTKEVGYEVPITTTIVYLLFVFIGPKIMSGFKPIKLTYIMAIYNFSLSLFSVLTFLITFTQLSNYVMEYGFERLATNPIELWSGPCFFWTWLFVQSKFIELADTFFLVLNKKQIIFLHYFHHATVLLYCWHSIVVHSPTGFFFCTVNAFIHSFMYFYYFLCCFTKPPFWGKYLTIAQIVQMFIGIGFCANWMYYKFIKKVDCPITGSAEVLAICGFLMYGSYLILFVLFYINRNVRTNNNNTKNNNNTNRVKLD
eukprot:TRINITY_DN1013_c0_g1_i1.p1 TRINITY_DN1013_c0_g1~~TRINITY_DN1013_c0_g1_i1.p1  ORF type:complete len:277 (-),score=76.68 TRINITY_DN1013_c0_g1_i1:61-891(-)